MGHDTTSTLFVVGQARLPQSNAPVAQTLTVELEVDLPSRRIRDANTTLGLPGLQALLRQTLVGARVDEARAALFDLEVRYSAPFSAALCTAIERALQRAVPEPTANAAARDRSPVLAAS